MVAARFAAMGTDAHVIITGGGTGALAFARERIERLERLWSRFRPGSEISAINAAGGRPVRVSPETVALVRLAVEAHDATDGLFDPTMLGSMLALGYDRTFLELGGDGPSTVPRLTASIRARVAVDETRMTVAVTGGGLDMGGIGKGYAADSVVAELMERQGVRGACVNLGGDLRVAGQGPAGGHWLVAVEHPFGDEPVGRIALEDGAVATTSRARRRWMQEGIERHHLVDPRTGLPAETGLASVTVVAGEAWWAEAMAKASFLAGAGHVARMMRDADVEGVAIAADGALLALGRSPLLVA